MAVDGAGSLYIADYFDNRIRKVTVATGIISTVAGNGGAGFAGDGGAATSASLWSPFGVAVDGAGNLYIADYANSRIREVTAATGIISTVAGNGTQRSLGTVEPQARLRCTLRAACRWTARVIFTSQTGAIIVSVR